MYYVNVIEEKTIFAVFFLPLTCAFSTRKYFEQNIVNLERAKILQQCKKIFKSLVSRYSVRAPHYNIYQRTLSCPRHPKHANSYNIIILAV